MSAEPLRRGCGLERGFDTYDFDVPVQDGVVALAERPGEETVREALLWARGSSPREGRHFLWVHFFDPHAPYEPRPPFRDLFPQSAYDGEVAQADHALGLLLDGLRSCGWLEGAAVVAAADHGEGLGDHGEDAHGYYLYDSTIRVPLVLSGAGLPPALSRGSQPGPASLVDVPATALALLGLAPAAGRAQGASLLDSPGSRPGLAFAETFLPLLHFRWAPLRSATKGPWKLVLAGRREHAFFFQGSGEEEAPPDSIPTGDLRAALEAFEASLPPPPGPAPAPDLGPLPGYLGSGGGYSTTNRPVGDLPDPHERMDFLRDLFRAETLCDRGACEEAQAILERLRLADAGNPAAAYWRARALRCRALARGGDAALLEEAHGAFREAAGLAGGSLDSENMAIGCLLGLGRLQEGRAALQALVADGRADARTWELLGTLLTGSPGELAGAENPWRDLKAGIRALEESLRRDPSSGRVRKRLEAAREAAGAGG